MSNLQFPCPSCKKSLNAGPEFVNKFVKCPKCNHAFLLAVTVDIGGASLPSRPTAGAANTKQPKESVWSSVASWPVIGSGVAASIVGAVVLACVAGAASTPNGTVGSGPGAQAAALAVEPKTSVGLSEKPVDSAGSTGGAVNSKGNPEAVDPLAVASKSIVRLETDADSLGTGFVVHDQQTIATNFHVIEGASEITATFQDGTKIKVSGFLAALPDHDLAVLRLAAPAAASALPLATTDTALGKDVFAIGMPIGLGFSVSKGVVSGYRTWAEIEESLGEGKFADTSMWVQTTTPFSPGNSGGPLLTPEGEVLAINTMIMSAMVGQNVNFSIRSTHLSSVLKSLPESVIALSKLPAGHKAEPKKSNSERDVASQQANQDRAAWDFVAETMGSFCLDISESILNLGPDAPVEAGRTAARNAAAKALLAIEKLERIPEDGVSSVLGGYVTAMGSAMSDFHRLSKWIAKHPEEVPTGEQKAIILRPFELLCDDSQAVLARLKWQHGGTWASALGFEEKELQRAYRVMKTISSHRQASRSTNAAKPNVEDGGVVFASVFAMVADEEKVLWESWLRALRCGRGEIALGHIVRRFPNTEDARRAQKLLDGYAESK